MQVVPKKLFNGFVLSAVCSERKICVPFPNILSTCPPPHVHHGSPLTGQYRMDTYADNISFADDHKAHQETDAEHCKKKKSGTSCCYVHTCRLIWLYDYKYPRTTKTSWCSTLSTRNSTTGTCSKYSSKYKISVIYLKNRWSTRFVQRSRTLICISFVCISFGL